MFCKWFFCNFHKVTHEIRNWIPLPRGDDTIRMLKKTKLVFQVCFMLILATKGVYAMQPPPPPLNIAQLKILVAKADIIVVGKINTVNERTDTEKTIEAALRVEKLLKGKVSGNNILIRETYKNLDLQSSDIEKKDGDESKKIIVSSSAGPRTYHGIYKKGSRMIVFLEKIGGTDKYMPLGSGTYVGHLCEFLIEDDGIKTLYFSFAEDLQKYAGSEKQFIDFVKYLTLSKPN
jgi:hypothetical protein